jgi:hypothetical protein
MNLRFVAQLCAAASLLPAAAPDPQLTKVQAVYILPMSGGLDQYLANRLTRGGRYQVVTDPALADAVLTDRLGPEFESRFTALYPPPEPPPAPEKEKETKEEKGSTSAPSFIDALPDSPTVRISSFSRGKGNVFLVDRGSRRVMWSAYERPRNTRPDEMDRVAEAVSDRLHDDAKRVAKLQTSTPAPPPAAPEPVTQPGSPPPSK